MASKHLIGIALKLQYRLIFIQSVSLQRTFTLRNGKQKKRNLACKASKCERQTKSTKTR